MQAENRMQELEILLTAYHNQMVLGRQLSDDATWQDIHAWDERIDVLQKRAEELLPELKHPSEDDWDEEPIAPGDYRYYAPS